MWEVRKKSVERGAMEQQEEEEWRLRRAVGEVAAVGALEIA